MRFLSALFLLGASKTRQCNSSSYQDSDCFPDPSACMKILWDPFEFRKKLRQFEQMHEDKKACQDTENDSNDSHFYPFHPENVTAH